MSLIGMIRPFLVEEGRRSAAGVIAAYAAATTAAAAAVGALAGEARGLVPASVQRHYEVTLIAALGLLIVLDVAGRTPTLRRQTHPLWWPRFGPRRAALAWGLDLGLGVTTIRVASLYWAVIGAIVLVGNPLVGAAAMAGYGIALAVNLTAGVAVVPRCTADFPYRAVMKQEMNIRNAAILTEIVALAVLILRQVQA